MIKSGEDVREAKKGLKKDFPDRCYMTSDRQKAMKTSKSINLKAFLYDLCVDKVRIWSLDITLCLFVYVATTFYDIFLVAEHF